jgi:hypothetical protein
MKLIEFDFKNIELHNMTYNVYFFFEYVNCTMRWMVNTVDDIIIGPMVISFSKQGRIEFVYMRR